MRWSFFFGVTIIVLLIFWFEWRKLKHNPKRDKAAFMALLLLVWLMSMMDLLYTPGPTSALAIIFKPFKGLVEQ
jgi:Ca2+/Na+ antiporter